MSSDNRHQQDHCPGWEGGHLSATGERSKGRKVTLSQLTRNFIHLGCPACGEPCSIQASRSIQERGADGMVQCRNIECGYRGTVQVSYGPVLQANRPNTPEEPQERMKSGVRNNFLRILCPHCQGVCRVRTSVQMIRAQRQLYVYCQDEACGYKGVVFITHTARLSLDLDGSLREIPLDAEVQEQCQQEMQLANEKYAPTKKKES